MNCIFKRAESQTTAGVDYKQKETPCECSHTHTHTHTHLQVFWGKIYGMEMSRLELAHINDFILYASTQLPGTGEVWDLRQTLMVSYQLVLRLPNTGLLSLGSKARLVAVGGGVVSPLILAGFLADTVNSGRLKGHSVCHP